MSARTLYKPFSHNVLGVLISCIPTIVGASISGLSVGDIFGRLKPSQIELLVHRLPDAQGTAAEPEASQGGGGENGSKPPDAAQARQAEEAPEEAPASRASDDPFGNLWRAAAPTAPATSSALAPPPTSGGDGDGSISSDSSSGSSDSGSDSSSDSSDSDGDSEHSNGSAKAPVANGTSNTKFEL